MNSPSVMIEVCLSFLRRYLSGFQGYPRNVAGENRFAEALQSNAVSVEHVEAVLKTFDEEFPTVRQIHDVAANLRPHYEPKEDQRAEWEKKYGKPEAFQKYPADQMAMHWQAFRDVLYYTEGPAKDLKSPGYWDDARFRALQDHPDSIAFVRHQVQIYGWAAIMQMEAAPEPMPYKSLNRPAKRSKVMAPIGARITQADIERAKAERKSTDQVDRELDAWDDPDR